MADTKTTPSLNDIDFPVLKGWVLLAEAADILGVTKQQAYRLAREKVFGTVHRIGTSNFYVVAIEEVERRRDNMAAKRAKRSETAA